MRIMVHVLLSMVFILSVLAFSFRPVKATVLMYDLNGDGKIDIKDTVVVARAFGTSAGHPRWNAQADLNNDGVIDLKDLFIISKHFGEPRVLVVPEYWMGTALGLTGCFAAFGLFALKRNHS